MPINPEDKEQYLKDPNHCPFCQSTEIKFEDRAYYEECRYYQDFFCTYCGGRWKDIYHLMNVVAII